VSKKAGHTNRTNKTKPQRPERVSDLLRLPAGPVDLAALDTRATPGFAGDKAAANVELAELGPRLADLQERLYAEGRTGGERSLLVVLQGMDTSGKGGTIRHVIGQVDPQGCHLTSFKAPTKEELGHDFLWRIRRRLPPPGMIGVFDRSHYEDVLIVRVHDLVPRATWSRRYATINRFEASLATNGCHLVKVFLHISPEEQLRRLVARLDDPSKRWKFNPRDVDERALWPAYQEAYAAALEKCNTESAPWYVVPADRKWYRNWAVSKLLVEQLEDLKPGWPEPDYDVAEQRARLLEQPR
jgi:PPK2 family polyphosphate:nucleotide phosphotransferase